MSVKELFEFEKQELDTLVQQTLQSIETRDNDCLCKQGPQCLLKLFIETSKFGGEQEKFFQHCCQYTNDTDKIELLWKLFNENATVFKRLSQNHENLATFSSLDWRLECEIASKSLNEAMSMSYQMKMNFSTKNENLLFTSDIPNLRHAIDSLDSALKAGKAVYLKQKNMTC